MTFIRKYTEFDCFAMLSAELYAFAIVSCVELKVIVYIEYKCM